MGKTIGIFQSKRPDLPTPLAFVVTESADLLSVSRCCVMQTLTEPGCDARSPETLTVAVQAISPVSPKYQKFKCYKSRAAALDQL